MDDGKVYDDYEWEYDYVGYLQALANNWQVLMSDNILDSVIENITITGAPISPREYNFWTDRAPIEIEYNETALQSYIEANREQYEKEKRRDHPGYWWLGDERDAEMIWYMEHASTVLYPTNTYVTDQYDKVNDYEYVSNTLIVK